jgi:hypothetical protein
MYTIVIIDGCFWIVLASLSGRNVERRLAIIVMIPPHHNVAWSDQLASE